MVNKGVSSVKTIVMALIVAPLTVLAATPRTAQAYTIHAPIVINGNADFIPENGVTGGNGTALDPYIIEGWQIDAGSANGITILNTDAYAIVRDVFVHSGGVNYDGIYLRGVANLVVDGGMFVNNNYGIVAYECSAVAIENNYVSDSFWEGIYVPGSSSVVVRGNDVRFSGVYGIDILTSSDVEVRDNKALSGFEDGIFVQNSARVFVTGNNVSSNALLGIGLDYSSDITVLNNSLWYNDYGLDLVSAERVVARQNVVGKSITIGVSVYYSNNATFEGNRIVSNELGLYAGFSKDVVVAHNDFDRNVIQGEDEFGARTAWDGGYPAGGNRWSDYAGTDNCSGPAQDVCPDPDGIGDVPYVVDMDTSDRYPLMQPWVSNRAPILIDGNSGFTPGNGVTGGSGTVVDPFVIEGWSIDANVADGIRILNADAHAVIRNVTVRSAGLQYGGIHLDTVANLTVENAVLDGGAGGLSIRNSSDILAAGNLVVGVNSDCVQVTNSSSVSIQGNLLGSCRSSGIGAQASFNIGILGNRAFNSGGGISLQQVDLATVTDNVLTDNNLLGPGRGISLEVSSNVTIKSNDLSRNHYGLFLADSRDVAFQRNAVAKSKTEAVHLFGSSNITFAENNFTQGGIGLYASNADGLLVISNRISANIGHGINLQYCGNVIVAGNHVSYSGGYGIRSNSSEVSAFHNDFVSNAGQAYDDPAGMSAWNDSYPSGGNFWSDYAGSDSWSGPNQDQPGGDGIGDTPYTIQGGVDRDMYPSMTPFIPGLLPDLAVLASDVSFTPSPPIQVGSSVLIGAWVWNLGSAPSGDTVVKFYDGVPPAPQIGQDQPLTSIPAVNVGYASVTWTPSEIGSHLICVVVDPENLIAEGSEANNTACVGVEVAFIITMMPGHRFVSFPLAAANDSIESVLSSISGCYDYVRWFDPLDAASPWKSYVPGRGYNDLLRLDNTMGFWIGVTSYCSFAPAGMRPFTTSVSLHAGWNMVGFPSFNTSYTVADLKSDLGLSGVMVEAFDPYVAPYDIQRVSDGYVMLAGEGYWIFVPSDTVWTVNG